MFDIVFVAAGDDVLIVKNNYLNILKRIIGAKRAIIITNSDGYNLVSSSKDLIVLNEDKIYPGLNFSSVRETIIKINKNAINTTGWYFQQLLKFAYSFSCEDDYYMVVDGDTLFVRNINMFEDNKPVFHTKNEYNEAYFDTISTLFNGKITKQIEESFIAEHMLFSKKYVKEMLSGFQNNDVTWFEFILRSINPNVIGEAGFSEFETYGSWVTFNHPDAYKIVHYESLRNGNFFLGGISDFNEKKGRWISKDYSAVSFEKWDRIPKERFLWDNFLVRTFLKPKLIEKIVIKIYSKLNLW